MKNRTKSQVYTRYKSLFEAWNFISTALKRFTLTEVLTLFIAEDNSEITNFKCVAKNKPEPSGTFQWTIGDKIVKSASISEETTKTGDETSTFEYTPKVTKFLFIEEIPLKCMKCFCVY